MPNDYFRAILSPSFKPTAAFVHLKKGQMNRSGEISCPIFGVEVDSMKIFLCTLGLLVATFALSAFV